MPLTQAQIDFEKDWAKRYVYAVGNNKFDDWKPFLKESTLVLRSPQPPMTGMATFQKLCATLEKVVRKWELSNLVVTVDEENQRIIATFDNTGYLNADPEQKPMKFSPVVILKKPLGVSEDKVDTEQSNVDSSPFRARMAELGLDPAEVMKPTA